MAVATSEGRDLASQYGVWGYQIPNPHVHRKINNVRVGGCEENGGRSSLAMYAACLNLRGMRAFNERQGLAVRREACHSPKAYESELHKHCKDRLYYVCPSVVSRGRAQNATGTFLKRSGAVPAPECSQHAPGMPRACSGSIPGASPRGKAGANIIQSRPTEFVELAPYNASAHDQLRTPGGVSYMMLLNSASAVNRAFRGLAGGYRTRRCSIVLPL
jgi:hypothetical protein